MARLEGLGAVLAEARERAGFATLGEAAVAIGVTAAAVGQWESGQTTPTDKNLRRLAAVYGTAPEELLREAARRMASGPVVRERYTGYAARGEEALTPELRARMHELLAALAREGATPEELDWAQRVLSAPGNYVYFAGGDVPQSAADRLLEMEGLAEGVRMVMREKRRRAAEAHGG